MTPEQATVVVKTIAVFIPLGISVCSFIAAGFNYAWTQSEIAAMPRWLKFVRGCIEKGALNSSPRP